MDVLDTHQRVFDLPPDCVGTLIDTLASDNDRLWPADLWPPMVFDGPLAVGAVGGHGPIRYRIDSYQPAQCIWFRFLGPRGFQGGHGFQVTGGDAGKTCLRHTLEMDTLGLARLSWPLLFRSLHMALIEDALARAQASLNQPPKVARWSPWVRLLRWSLTFAKAPSQRTPEHGRGAIPGVTFDRGDIK